MRIHTGECPYPCPIEGCSRKFRQRSQQYSHLRRNHDLDTDKLAAMWNGLGNHPAMNEGGQAIPMQGLPTLGRMNMQNPFLKKRKYQ
jgi:hypothetical protein